SKNSARQATAEESDKIKLLWIRINQVIPFHFSESSGSMGIGVFFGHNVPDFPLSEENGGVSNHVSMTTPGNSFGAHYCRGLPRGELKQIIKPSPEFWGCHIIGIAPKGRMMPACISRSGTGFATAAKFFAGKVTDSL